MRTQRQRDEVTLTIATAVLLFVVVVAGGYLAVTLLRLLSDDVPWGHSLWPVTVGAGLVAAVHLHRHRRP